MKFFEYLGVKTLEEARAIDAETLRDKASAFRNAGIHRWGLCVDGTFLPDQPNQMLCDNRRLQIPVMIGNTDDEFTDVFPAKTYEEFEAQVNERLGDAAAEFLKLCGKGRLDEQQVMANAKVNRLGLWRAALLHARGGRGTAGLLLLLRTRNARRRQRRRVPFLRAVVHV